MSYDISFKAKLEGIDRYLDLGYCEANITYNVREIITRSTGLPWNNCENNGYCKDIIPAIAGGLKELISNGSAYKQYEAANGWGTVKGTIHFFQDIINAWTNMMEDDEELCEIATFWIE